MNEVRTRALITGLLFLLFLPLAAGETTAIPESEVYGGILWGFQVNLDNTSVGLNPLPKLELGWYPFSSMKISSIHISLRQPTSVFIEPGMVSGSFSPTTTPYADSSLVFPLTSRLGISWNVDPKLDGFQKFGIGLSMGSLYAHDNADTWIGGTLSGASTSFSLKANLWGASELGPLRVGLQFSVLSQIFASLVSQQPAYGALTELSVFEDLIPLRLLLGGTYQMRRALNKMDNLGLRFGLRLFDSAFDPWDWKEKKSFRTLNFIENSEDLVAGVTLFGGLRQVTDWVISSGEPQFRSDYGLSGYWPWAIFAGELHPGLAWEWSSVGTLSSSKWTLKSFAEWIGVGDWSFFAQTRWQGFAMQGNVVSFWASLGASLNLPLPRLQAQVRWDSGDFQGLSTSKKNVMGELSLSIKAFLQNSKELSEEL